MAADSPEFEQISEKSPCGHVADARNGFQERLGFAPSWGMLDGVADVVVDRVELLLEIGDVARAPPPLASPVSFRRPTQTYKAVRRAIQNSQASLRALANRYGINQKTVCKWRNRSSATDLPTGPKKPRSTVLSVEEEAVVVAFRRHTLLPLDDCLYALQATIPHLTRSSLHRCLQRHGISRLPDVEGDKPAKKKFKAYPIGFFHIDIAEVRTEEVKLYLFLASDRA